MLRRRGWLWIALLPLACIAYQWIVHAAIVDAPATSMRLGLAVLNGIPHAAINLFLLWLFARTLIRGHEALITRFARTVHASLPRDIEAYTRHVTRAWCVFFGAQVLASAILFALASLENWSLFVNVLSFPLVPVMFVAEYLYRLARFPDFPHASIWQGVRAFVDHEQLPHTPEVRAPN
jgi:uncharacterized membrane protein